MTEFYCHFPRTLEPIAFDTLAFAAGQAGESSNAQPPYKLECGMGVCTEGAVYKPLNVYVDAERGGIAIKGVLYDTLNSSKVVEARDVFEYLVSKESPMLNRFEGAFGLALYDKARRRGLLFNDQLSMIHLYYVELSSGLFVSTRPLPLAKALRLPLDPMGVGEFLARGQLIPPSTVFAGMRQLSLGQHVIWHENHASTKTHWQPYSILQRIPFAEAVKRCCEVITHGLNLVCKGRQHILCDITGGYDSRLVLAACNANSISCGLTTNGSDENLDVKIARKISTEQGYPWIHGTRLAPPLELNEKTARQLLFLTNGELVPTECADHLIKRPILCRDYEMHLTGGAGETLRSFPWGQEFFGIGRRRPANVDRAVRYRFLQSGRPPAGMFTHDWFGAFSRVLTTRVREMCLLCSNTLTTQQLDAVYLWKNQGHVGAYTSALYGLMPTIAPLSVAGIQSLFVAIPWSYRLNARLVRAVIYALCPELAHFRTQYGSTAAPIGITNIHLEAVQAAKKALHLFNKVGRVRRASRVSGAPVSPEVDSRLIRQKQLVAMYVNPPQMQSIALFNQRGLREALCLEDKVSPSNLPFLSRSATIEMLCRELGFVPTSDFLNLAG